MGAIRQHPWCQEGAREYTLYQNACISYVTGDRCPNGGHGTIPVRTLDSYQLRGVAVVKVDVEGNEPAVLRGAVATLCRWRPTVWAECADRDVTDLAAVTVVEPVTVADIDEALGYAAGSHHRDRARQRWVDALLDQRLRLTT